MLTTLSIRDVVLVDALDLEVEDGLTVLTGETGAGKSIILDALGLALGARSDAGLVRNGAKQASATAVFTAPDDEALIALLSERGFEVAPGEELILRRVVSADGRSRAYVNDQPAGVTALREIGALLVEVHGQHETVGLLDWKTHRALLDNYGGLQPQLAGVAGAAERLKAAQAHLDDLVASAAEAAAKAEEIAQNLADLDALDPKPDEETELAGERAILGAAEKAVADLADARNLLGGDKLSQRLASALRAVEHARQRAVQAGAEGDNPIIVKLASAAEAVDRALVEATEAVACVDAAADAFDFEPGRLDKAEERLFALRAASRKYAVPADQLAALAKKFKADLADIDAGEARLGALGAEAEAARAAYAGAAETLSASRRAAAATLDAAVMAELPDLKLERARFATEIESDAAGPEGVDRVEFWVQTNPGTRAGPLAKIASGGELSRFMLALKVALADRGSAPTLVFDEIDTGVGGAVADAIGARLARLACAVQVLSVTHAPQVAARASSHFLISKAQAEGETRVATRVSGLAASERKEEIARMLAGASVTEEARAAAARLLEGAA